MSKIFGFYANDEDQQWYQSSNIRYSKCLDHDNNLKTLRVIFNNGTQYEYKNVSVQDYLFFRDSTSQGKALNQYIKGKNYEYEKMENADMQALEEELNFRMEGGIFVLYDGDKFIIKDNKDNVICEKDVKLTEAAFQTICSALEAVGKQLYAEGKKFIEDGENGEDKPF